MSIRVDKPAAALGAPFAVVWRRVDELRRDAKKPRAPSPAQIRQLAKTIQDFGLNVPILVDRELRIMAGHVRFLAARELGWCEVPTILLDHLSPAQARVFMVADERFAEAASWDDLLLAMQLKELSLSELDVSTEPALDPPCRRPAKGSDHGAARRSTRRAAVPESQP
jgi:ParB-like nuclease domain